MPCVEQCDFRWINILRKLPVQFSSVQSLSHVWLFATPWIAARQASLSITNPRSSVGLMSIESVMPSSHLIHLILISSSAFSSCPQSLPESESFPMSQLFTWGGPSIGVSALASFLPKKSQGWSHTLLFSKLSYNILKVQRRHSEVFFFNHLQNLITK